MAVVETSQLCGGAAVLGQPGAVCGGGGGDEQGDEEPMGRRGCVGATVSCKLCISHRFSLVIADNSAEFALLWKYPSDRVDHTAKGKLGLLCQLISVPALQGVQEPGRTVPSARDGARLSLGHDPRDAQGIE